MRRHSLAIAALAAGAASCFSSSGDNSQGPSFDGGLDVTTFDANDDDVMPSPSDAGVESGAESSIDGSTSTIRDAAADGAADATVDADAAGAAEASSCDGGVGAVDQSSLAFAGCIYATPTQLVGQTFTVGSAGTLTGIEVSIGSCGIAPPAGTSYELDLHAGSTRIASASLPTSLFGTACSPPPLSASTTGPGYFDLSSACLAVSAGEMLAFTVVQIAFPVGACSPASGTCTAGKIGDPCMVASDCDFSSCVDESTSVTYDGGVLTTNGTPQMLELDFKTYVR